MKNAGGLVLALGVALGAAFTASPLTILFALAMAIACRAATRDLDRNERRRVLAAVAVAIAVRVLAIVALLAATNPLHQQFGSFFPDARYAIERSWWIRNRWLGVPIGPHAMFGIFDPYGASSFSYVLAAIQAAVGESPYGVDLVSVAALVCGGLILFRLARSAYGPSAAEGALLIALFWPTLMAWSVSTLREATQLFLVAGALAGAVAVVRCRGWRVRTGWALVTAAAVAATATLRSGAVAIVATAIPVALAIRAATLRASAAAMSAAAVVAVGLVLLARADVRAFIEYQADLAANRHLGQALSGGHAYRLLDDRFYTEGPQSTFTLTRSEALRFFARAAGAFVLEPLPWRTESWAEAAVVPQQIAWYALVALAVLGAREAWRRDPLVTAVLASYAATGLMVIAPNSGNVGTLVRHRDAIVPAVACLSAVGWLSMLTRRRSVDPLPLAAQSTARGRLGRVNAVDAAALAAALLVVVAGAATVRAFRPVAPAIDGVEPAVLHGADRQLRVHGRDLTAYLRVFVGPTGEPLLLSDPVKHGREATWRWHSTTDGELDVPPATRPGSYSLYIFDEGRQLATVPSAFTMRRE